MDTRARSLGSTIAMTFRSSIFKCTTPTNCDNFQRTKRKMFRKAEEEFGSSAGGKAGDLAVDAAAEAAAKRLRSQALQKKKKNLLDWVTNDANRPVKTYEKVKRLRSQALQKKKKNLLDWVTNDANRPVKTYEKVLASVAYEGLRRDYMRLCTSTEGGLVIVYDDEGTGKSYALQAVARAHSAVQPRRFLCINITGTNSCQRLYENIKLRVLGDVQDFDFMPEEVAEIIKFGLCGPPGCEISSLKATSKKCRLDIDAVVGARKKRNDFPILVIDEFNPHDFSWEKDYTIGELMEELGDAFRFFNALTGEAHASDGFVAFVGTKSEAFARALHKINGGTKSALARSTTIAPSDGRPFSDWQGIQWTRTDKEIVVRGKYEEKLKQALRQQGFSEDDVNTKVLNFIQSASSRQNIRFCREKMAEVVVEEEENAAAKIQSRPQKSPTAAGRVAVCTDQVQDNCSIM